MFDALTDPLFKPALKAFLKEQREEYLKELLQAVRMPERATLKEAFIAGKVEAYESFVSEVEKFAAKALNDAAGG